MGGVRGVPGTEKPLEISVKTVQKLTNSAADFHSRRLYKAVQICRAVGRLSPGMISLFSELRWGDDFVVSTKVTTPLKLTKVFCTLILTPSTSITAKQKNINTCYNLPDFT